MKLPAILTLSICLFQTLVYGDEIYISPDIGGGHLEIKPNYSINGVNVNHEYTTTGFAAGYMSDINIFAEAGISLADSFNLFEALDNYKLYEIRLATGYSLKVFKHFRIVPKIGLSLWEMHTKEGQLFNPGKEEKKEFRGTNVFCQINLEFPISDFIQIYASYVNSNYDFGEVESTKAGVKLSFDI